MNPKGCNPPSWIPPVHNKSTCRGYNEESGTCHRAITTQTNCIRKPLNGRQLSRLKSWHNIVKEDHIGQLCYDLEGAADIENVRITIEASLADKI